MYSTWFSILLSQFYLNSKQDVLRKIISTLEFQLFKTNVSMLFCLENSINVLRFVWFID